MYGTFLKNENFLVIGNISSDITSFANSRVCPGCFLLP